MIYTLAFICTIFLSLLGWIYSNILCSENPYKSEYLDKFTLIKRKRIQLEKNRVCKLLNKAFMLGFVTLSLFNKIFLYWLKNKVWAGTGNLETHRGWVWKL